jgi:hypothetical protein
MGKVVKAVIGVALLVAAAIAVPFVGAFIWSLGVSMTVATAIASVVVGLATSFIGRALAGTPSAGKPTPFNYRQAIGNSFIIIGKRRQGGQLIFYHPRKVGDDHFRYFVFAAAGHRCQGVTKWYLNDKEVTVNGAGLVTSGDYANDAWLWFARGTDTQTANSTFVSECGGKWTADHRGRGIALIYAKFKMTKDVIAAGMPVMSAEIEGSDEIRDPRTDTIGYTRLTVPAAYWWVQLPREEGGFGSLPDEIPDDTILSAWTNICDEDVPTLSGTEKRYEVDALIETGSEPSRIREAFVLSMAGSHVTSEGIEMLRPGYWVPPSLSLLERDLDGPIRVPLLNDPQAIATEINATYVDPESLYQPQPAPIRSVVSAELQQLSADFPFLTSHTRVQRVAEIMLRRAQCEKRVSWPINIIGLGVRPMQSVQCDTDRFGLSNYAFTVDSWNLAWSADGPQVQLALREENAEIYDDPVLKPKPGTAAPDIPDPIPDEVDVALLAMQAERANEADLADQANSVGGTWTASAIASLEARIAALEP